MRTYADFLASKAMTDPATGLTELPDLPDCLFPHQRDIVGWALRRGRAALFAGTGLGKSLMELVWAQAVARHTGRPVLLLAPLAVSAQMVREAQKFGIAAHLGDGEGICISNYQKLDHFDLSKFGAVILDESSILKSTDGHYRSRLIEACQSIPFRLAATATPAPNDFMELGNHAEFLGVMSYSDMLATFFVHDGGSTQNWRLKGHAENEFWRWMASWAVMLRQPSDLGYANDGYDLPPLHYQQHVVSVEYRSSAETGLLFPMQAATLAERIAARRDTVAERVAKAVEVVLGSFGDKLAEWYGSQNTPNAGAHAENQTQSIGRSETSNPPATSSAGRNTCENIEQTISISGSEHQSSGIKSTPADANDTPPMLNIGSALNPSPDSERRKSGASNCSEQNTISRPPNMTNYFEGKVASAPFAIGGTEESGSISTTATTKAMSEDFSARHATPGSGNSRTTQIASQGLSNISEKLEPWVVWCHLNSEQDALKKAFGPLAISIHGGQSEDEKEQLHQDWLNGKAPILICKPKMFGYGLNWQHCRNTLFVGLNDSFEQYYQAIRRFWRFGQTRPVTCHIIAAETEGATVANIRRKEADADRMAAAMVMHMADLSSASVRGTARDRPDYDPQQPVVLPPFLAPLSGAGSMIKAIDQVITDEYAIYQGDSCELIRAIPGDSVHFGIHSPPFEGLYKFSNYDRDISNNEGPGFWEHYQFLIAELLRVTMPGRLHSVHVMQLPTSKIRHGHIGMRDFRGEVIRAYEDAGWIFHSEVCIWKDPVVAQQRTKSIRLLHKQVVKDSTISGQGLADYIVSFRKPGDNPAPVSGCFDRYSGTDEPPREKYTSEMDGRNWYSIEVWQRYASPVWMDINQTRTLQYRSARDEKDEQHISPLQLDVIERCIDLWSNPGETVLTPFLGIGSEVWCAVRMGRKGVGIELKPSYFAQAKRNLDGMQAELGGLFEAAE